MARPRTSIDTDIDGLYAIPVPENSHLCQSRMCFLILGSKQLVLGDLSRTSKTLDNSLGRNQRQGQSMIRPGDMPFPISSPGKLGLLNSLGG